jgi:HK97 family phage prohead protease
MELNRIYWQGTAPQGREVRAAAGGMPDYTAGPEFKESAGTGDRYLAVLSTASVDLQGDSINPDGWDMSRYHKYRGLPALWSHNAHQFPIGKWTQIRVENGRLLGELTFAPTGRAQEARKLVEGKFLAGISVGFIPGKYEPRRGKDATGYDFKSGHLLIEASLCANGCCPDAMILGAIGKSADGPDAAKRAEKLLKAHQTVARIRADDEKHRRIAENEERRSKMTPEEIVKDRWAPMRPILGDDEVERRIQRWRDRAQS